MSGAQKTVTLDDLQAYLDGELEAARRDDVESHLSKHPEDAARIESYRAQDAALRDALMGITEEPVPDRLIAALTDAPPRSPMPWWANIAAALLLLAIGGAIGWGVGNLPGPPAAQVAFLDSAVAAHRTFAVEERHPVEVSAAEMDVLRSWLSERLGTNLMPPDLGRAGLTLVGGRLLPASKGPAAVLLYETAEGDRITCYITAKAEQLKPGQIYRVEGGGDDKTGVLAWPTKKFDYAIAVSNPEGREQLVQVAKLVNEELSKSENW